MLKKNILKSLSGVIFVSVVVVSVMLPVKAAVTRSVTYKWNKGYT